MFINEAFSAHLRDLKDPKGVLGGYERIHALAHIGFYPQNPKVAMFLSRMQLPLDQLQAAMDDAQQTSYEEAVKNISKSIPRGLTIGLRVNSSESLV